jgi:hypothetical protein
MQLTVVEALEARDWPRSTQGLLTAAEPHLLVSRLTGGALALGRWQLASDALSESGLEKPWVRRATGGRTVALGEGLLAVAMVLPHRSALVSADPEALPAGSFLNRAVRPLLEALARLGVPATYFGRDFVTWESGQGPLLGFDLAASGAALFEAIIPAEAHWWPPEPLLFRPPPPPARGAPAPAMSARMVGVTASRLAEALAHVLQRSFSIDLTPATASPPRVDVPDHDPVGPGTPPVQTVLGSARWSLAPPHVRLHGDLLFDSAGMSRLETDLAAGALERSRVESVWAGLFADPRHALLGLRDPSPLLDALLTALPP